MIEATDGLSVLRVTDSDEAWSLFSGESGGHRWQRIPPTEKHDRVHSSTITVAVMRERTSQADTFDEADVEMKAVRGSGPGGQNRNKVSSAVILTHKPSGETVRCETERSQVQNRRLAIEMLRARLTQKAEASVRTLDDVTRRYQVGSGERGDKRRTVAVQRGEVIDHVSGRRWRFSDYARGAL